MRSVRLDMLARQTQLRNSRAPVVSIAKAGVTSPHTPAPNPNATAIPQPAENVANLAACVVALKASVESLVGQRGDPPDRAVTFKDLVNYGVLSGDAVRSRQGTLVIGTGGGVSEAPADGVLYSRRGSDASWQPSPGAGGGGIPDAPTDSVAYGRENSSWVPVLALSGDVLDGGNF